jgi:hypothetical protein
MRFATSPQLDSWIARNRKVAKRPLYRKPARITRALKDFERMDKALDSGIDAPDREHAKNLAMALNTILKLKLPMLLPEEFPVSRGVVALIKLELSKGKELGRLVKMAQVVEQLHSRLDETKPEQSPKTLRPALASPTRGNS